MDRVTHAVARQVETDGRGSIVFRDMYAKRSYQVTAEERNTLIDTFQRFASINTLATRFGYNNSDYDAGNNKRSTLNFGGFG